MHILHIYKFFHREITWINSNLILSACDICADYMRAYQREGMRARITHAYLSGLPSMSVAYYREQLEAEERAKCCFRFRRK